MEETGNGQKNNKEGRTTYVSIELNLKLKLSVCEFEFEFEEGKHI